MSSRILTLFGRLVPSKPRRYLRRKWFAMRPPTMAEGVGRGLRFDPGPSNPDYGSGNNERPVQDALNEHVRPGDVVFDIGANVGFFSVICARLTGPTGRVVAFEPVRENADLIRRNARLNRMSNVTVIEKAVTDVVGTGNLTLAQYSGGAALSTSTNPPDPAGSIEVEVITIDDAVSSGEVPLPAVVKIDVEGAELEVLRGMSSTIARQHPTIVCEVDDETQAGYDRKYRACTDYLRELGYQIIPLADSYAGSGWLVGHFVGRWPSPGQT